MNVVLFVGNGLDLALNLKTSYSEMVKARIEEAPLLQAEENLLKWFLRGVADKKWSDFELMLGRLDEGFRDADDASDIDQAYVQALQFVHDNIVSYLIKQEKLLDVRADAGLVLAQTLIGLLKEAGFSVVNRIAVVPLTLNYTNSLERIIQTSCPSEGMCWHDVVHLHGDIARRTTIFGLDNPRQVSEHVRSLMRSADQILVKCRKMEMIRAVNSCLCQADVVVLYGVSFGETDLTWWAMLNECVSKNIVVPIICLYPEFDGQDYADAQNAIRGKLHDLGWSLDSLTKIRFPQLQSDANRIGFGDFLGINRIVNV